MFCFSPFCRNNWIISETFKLLGRKEFCGKYPILRCLKMFFWLNFILFMIISHLSALMEPNIIWRSVDFPVPLPPNIEVISFVLQSIETLSRIFDSSNFLVKFFLEKYITKCYIIRRNCIPLVSPKRPVSVFGKTS